MIFLHTLLPFFFSFILANAGPLALQQDLQQDLLQLQQNDSHFISDSSTDAPSVQTVAQDLQLFSLVAGMDLSQAKYSKTEQGRHTVQQWLLNGGNIRSITQVESHVPLDTLVTQRYLNGRAPTQQRITNNFTFRSYLISTANDSTKLYYLTEAEQGLLAYRLGEKQVQITYASPKQGLSDVLPVYRQQLENLLHNLPSQ